MIESDIPVEKVGTLRSYEVTTPLDKDALAEMIENTMVGQTITQQKKHKLQNELSVDCVINLKIIEQDILILGPKKMREIIEIFDDTANSILSSLQDALDETNSKQVKALVHKLKGSAGSLGLNALCDICLSIEKSEQPIEAYKHAQSQLLTLIRQSSEALYQIINETPE